MFRPIQKHTLTNANKRQEVYINNNMQCNCTRTKYMSNMNIQWGWFWVTRFASTRYMHIIVQHFYKLNKMNNYLHRTLLILLLRDLQNFSFMFQLRSAAAGLRCLLNQRCRELKKDLPEKVVFVISDRVEMSQRLCTTLQNFSAKLVAFTVAK